jgi:predicted nicotinamide N-methyase
VTIEEMRRFIRERTGIAPVPLLPRLRLYQASELTQLWHATEAELARTDPAPFWAFPWAGGQALARLLSDRPELVRGRTVLDIGTGSGLVAIAAAASGARSVVACDVDPFCEAAVGLNAELNGVSIEFQRHDFLAGDAPGDGRKGPSLWKFELILAGDLFYEKALAEGVLPRLIACVTRGARALVGDPGRIYSPRAGLAELARYEVPTSPEVESASSLLTRVLEVLPA